MEKQARPDPKRLRTAVLHFQSRILAKRRKDIDLVV